MIPPSLDPEKERMSESLSDLDPPRVAHRKTNGIDPFESKVTLIGENARIAKSTGPIKPAQKSKTIPHAEPSVLCLEKEQHIPCGRKSLV